LPQEFFSWHKIFFLVVRNISCGEKEVLAAGGFSSLLCGKKNKNAFSLYQGKKSLASEIIGKSNHVKHIRISFKERKLRSCSRHLGTAAHARLLKARERFLVRRLVLYTL